MDHSIAHLFELNHESTEYKTIWAKVGEQDEAPDKRDETLIQNKEQNELSDFFNRLSEVIINYDEVLLFGPTNAKTEFVNTLKDNHHFDKVKINVKPADKMTENHLQYFVNEHFNTNG
jgi:stalled ribosome rescue protein Dom34